MKQTTFASLSYAAKKKRTRREVFLEEMEKVVPWRALEALIEPYYPRSGRRGRPPIGLSTMLRVHFLQQWYGYSDPAMEDALYEVESMRRFIAVELNEDAIPDETTILKFRRLLEQHDLAPQILATVNGYLTDHGLLLRKGTVVDATIVAAASSTKNRDAARDPEMHQTKKGNQWHFGMTSPTGEGRHAVPVRAADAVTSKARPHQAHIGVDVHTGVVHTVTATAANAADVTEVANLLHGEETTVYGDAGYTGAAKRVDGADAMAWHIAEKRSVVAALVEGPYKEAVQAYEHLKARVRARVEHPFRVIKRQFGYRMVRYKGLAKNAAQVMTLFALANLWMKRRTLLANAG
ncbi:MAG: IS5/IS1182 family transposase [Gammaproteobacteria bacterium HGW-Gammaproteobacteria-7]|nr:MAG: IS5/IS1182 family transposase [Gammaproteobacteria bacterium HGW-Gammaproteobacteria-7]